jgi:hypothetical protein
LEDTRDVESNHDRPDQGLQEEFPTLVQQKESRLRASVREEPLTGGVITERHGDRGYSQTPHGRRKVNAIPWEWADLTDKPKNVFEIKYLEAYTSSLSGRMRPDPQPFRKVLPCLPFTPTLPTSRTPRMSGTTFSPPSAEWAR